MACPICGLFRKRTSTYDMCDQCGRSYDRYAFSDCSVLAAMVWAAERARRFARRAARGRP